MRHDRPTHDELADLVETVLEEARQRVREDCARVPEDVAALLETIARRLFDPGFDISTLRRQHAPSGTTLWRFRAALGLNPKAYLNLRRCEAARRLVSVPHLPLSVIAAALGFADAERFSKWFKWQTGESPRQHRLSSRPEPRPPEESPTIQRFRRLLLGDLHHHEAARWVRHLTGRGGDEA